MTTTQTDTGAKAKGRKNGIWGFYVGKLDGTVMRKFVKAQKLKIDTSVDDEQLAAALSGHFKESVAEDDQVRCDNCRGVSHQEFESCPFCGDEGEVEEEAPVAAAATPPESDASLIEEDDEEEDADEVEAAADDEDEEDEEDEEEAEAPAPPKKKEGAKMATTDTAVNGSGHGAKKSAALAKAAPTEMKARSAKDLDKAVAEFRKLQTNAHVSYFEMGQKVLEINEKQLWKLRQDENGKLKYKSFEMFVNQELGMSPTHAYSMIDAAKHYESAEEIRELGGKTKAVLILKAAPVDREKLKEKAKAGASKRELEKDVKESRKKHGAPKQSQQAKAGTRAKEAQSKAKAKVAEKITVANITGSRTIKLFKKPEVMKGLVWPPEKRALKLGDVPFGRLELQPGVVQYFSVIQKEDGIVLNIQTVREGA